MKALAELGFIDIKEGPSGPLSYALIKNPYLAIKALKVKGDHGVTAEKYNALVERCIDIGETSLDEDVPNDLEGVYLTPPTAPEIPTPPAVASNPATLAAILAAAPPMPPATTSLAPAVAPTSGQPDAGMEKWVGAQQAAPTPGASAQPATAPAAPPPPPPPPKAII